MYILLLWFAFSLFAFRHNGPGLPRSKYCPGARSASRRPWLQRIASFTKEQISREWSRVNGPFRDLDVSIALLSVHFRFAVMISY